MATWVSRCNDWIARRMFLGVFAALALGVFIKPSLIPNPKLAAIVLFSYMTLVTALGTSLRQFVSVLKRPWIPLWILTIVHVLTPLLAWAIGIIFYPEHPLIRLGYLIGATIPVGATSVLWTAIAQGDVPVSLVAVTLDTLAAPIVLPAFFLVVVGKSLSIDYLEMTKQLLYMITLPSIAGMLLHDATKGKVNQFAKGIGGVTSKLCFFAVIMINAAVVAPEIQFDAAIVKIALVTFIVILLNYVLGYMGAFIAKSNRQTTVSIVYNVGLRNISTGLVIALSYFPPIVAIPITLGMLYQQPLAAVVPKLLNKQKTEAIPAEYGCHGCHGDGSCDTNDD